MAEADEINALHNVPKGAGYNSTGGVIPLTTAEVADTANGHVYAVTITNGVAVLVEVS
jgi:hypothetical protein